MQYVILFNRRPHPALPNGLRSAYKLHQTESGQKRDLQHSGGDHPLHRGSLRRTERRNTQQREGPTSEKFRAKKNIPHQI